MDGLALSSSRRSSPCKSLKIMEPQKQSCALECIQEDSVYSDTEVTWAVQVLDRIIMLAKQWCVVANNPGSSYEYNNSIRQSISESEPAEEEDRQTAQLQIIQPYQQQNHSPLSSSSSTPTSEEFPEFPELFLQVQQELTDAYSKRKSMGNLTMMTMMMREASMQEMQLDSIKKHTEDSQSIPECSDAVKTPGIMKRVEDLKDAAIHMEPETETEHWHARIGNARSKHSLEEEIKAEFRQFPPQSLEEFELHEDNDDSDLDDLRFAQHSVDHKYITSKDDDGTEEPDSPSMVTFEQSTPISVRSEDRSTVRTTLKRLYIKIPQDEPLFDDHYDHMGAVSCCEDPNGKPAVARTELEYPCGAAFTYRDSPTSTLSEEPNERAHPTEEASDSSEWTELRYPCSSTFVYRDNESSSSLDSESRKHIDPCERLEVMKAAAAAAITGRRLPSHLPEIQTVGGVLNMDSNPAFGRATKEEAARRDNNMPEQTEIQAEGGEPCSPGFTYTDSPVSVLPKESSSMDYQRSETAAAASSSPDVDFSELQLFRQATNWEPWLLQRDGDDALDEADLQFLFPSCTKHTDTTNIAFDASEEEEALREEKEQQHHVARFGSLTPKSRRLQELQNQWWLPSLPETERSSRGGSKRRQELSKSIEQLARNLSKRHSMDIPCWSQNASTDDDDNDEEIFPSVKSWEIQEEEEGTPKKTPPPTQQRHHWKPQQGKRTVSYLTTSGHSRSTSSSFVPSSSPNQRSTTALVPCGGRFFSWPGWILTFSASKVRFKDAERRSADVKTSFGGGGPAAAAAHRPAQTVKSSVPGSRKSHASMTVADILRGDLGEDFKFSTVVGVYQQYRK